MALRIGDPISGAFGEGAGSTGCFLTGNFFGIPNCTVGLTAAHVLFALAGDSSAKAMSKQGGRVEESGTGNVNNPQQKAKARVAELSNQTIQTRSEFFLWALRYPDYVAAGPLHREPRPPMEQEKFALYKRFMPLFPSTPTDMSHRYFCPFVEGARERDWALVVMQNNAQIDNTPPSKPTWATGNWTGSWRDPNAGETVFKYGKTTKLTEGSVFSVAAGSITVKKLQGSTKAFSGEGDSGAAVFVKEANGNYCLVGIVIQGGSDGSTILPMSLIAREINELHSEPFPQKV